MLRYLILSFADRVIDKLFASFSCEKSKDPLFFAMRPLQSHNVHGLSSIICGFMVIDLEIIV